MFKRKNEPWRAKDHDGVIEKSLAEIYRDMDGNLPDVSVIDNRDKRGRIKIFFLVATFFAIIIGAVTWGGYQFFQKYINNRTAGRVELELTGDGEVSAGGAITYKVYYQNSDFVDLNNVSLRVRYPRGLIDVTTNPIASEEDGDKTFEDVWRLDTLRRNDAGTIEIKGKIIGEVNSEEGITAILSFTPKNLNTPFNETKTISTKIVSTEVQFDFIGPREVFTSDTVSYQIKVKNISGNDLSNLKIVLACPGVFTIKEVAPAADEGSNTWVIAGLKSEEEKVINFNGQVMNSVSEAEFKVGLWLGGVKDEYYLQEEEIIRLEIQDKQSLSTNLLLNGNSDNVSVSFGDTLNYSFIFENRSGKELKDVTVTAHLEPSDPELLEAGSLTEQYKGDAKGVAGKITITWDKRNFDQLAVIKPNDKGVINYTIDVRPVDFFKGRKSVDLNNLKVIGYITIKVNQIGESATTLVLESNKFESLINTDLGLAVTKNGPLPTLLDQTTTNYKVIWTVTNSIHEVENLSIKTKLPTGIVWSDKTNISAGGINYEVTTSTATWQLNRLPVGLNEPVTIEFQIQINNNLLNVTKILTEETILTGTDKATGQAIKITKSRLET